MNCDIPRRRPRADATTTAAVSGDLGRAGPRRCRPGVRRAGAGASTPRPPTSGRRTAPIGRPRLHPRRQPDLRDRRAACWPRWRGPAAPAPCSPPGWRPPPRSSSRCCRATTSWSPGCSTGGCASGWPSSRSPGGWTWSSSTPPTSRRVASAIRPGRTRLLWVETPANPMWEITDLAGICAMAHAAGVRVAVDNTVATPVLTRPLELGADLVVHSATKYLNGHSDVLAGAVLTARRDPFWERIRSWRRNGRRRAGPVRGVAAAARHAHPVPARAPCLRQRPGPARHLHGHPALTAVLYPGLPSHPGHQIAARQMHGGFGGMLSIRLAGGAEQAWRCGRGSGVQAGHLAGRGREPHRAPAQPGGALLPGARGSAAPVDRHRGPRGPAG